MASLIERLELVTKPYKDMFIDISDYGLADWKWKWSVNIQLTSVSMKNTVVSGVCSFLWKETDAESASCSFYIIRYYWKFTWVFM